MGKLGHYGVAALLFEFPDVEYPQKVQEVIRTLRKDYSEAAADIDYFLAQFPVDDVNAMQELYTRSFDVQAITTLDVGYVLFGDDYKRGELLVNLNRELREAEIQTRGELADHLPNVLRLLPRLGDQELINELVNELLVPALDSMIAEFDPTRVQKRNEMYKKHYKTVIDSAPETATIYSYSLKAIRKMLEADFTIVDHSESIRNNDFLRSVDRELSIKE